MDGHSDEQVLKMRDGKLFCYLAVTSYIYDDDYNNPDWMYRIPEGSGHQLYLR